MTASDAAWPVKKREIVGAVFDSRRWNGFPFRNDDIVISTYGKAGTTWTQQIVAQLVSQGAEDAPLDLESPWLDFRLIPEKETKERLEAQIRRRYIKTHLPLDALVYDPRAKYIFVAREGRDIIWSGHNHFFHSKDELFKNANQGAYGRFERPPPDPVQYFRAVMEDDSNPTSLQPIWSYFRGWYGARGLPNLLMVHFNDLKSDMPGEIKRIADFLEIPVSEEAWPRILEHCSFDYMKSHAERLLSFKSGALDGGAQRFIHKGTNGRWRDLLTTEEIARYEEKARDELGEECARWLMCGRDGMA